MASNATKAKSSKSKSAKQALPKSVPSKKTAYSGNSFVQAALAKYEATESVASNIAESKKNSRKKTSEKSKDVSKKKTKVDEFDFEDVEDFRQPMPNEGGIPLPVRVGVHRQRPVKILVCVRAGIFPAPQERVEDCGRIVLPILGAPNGGGNVTRDGLGALV